MKNEIKALKRLGGTINHIVDPGKLLSLKIEALKVCTDKTEKEQVQEAYELLMGDLENQYIPVIVDEAKGNYYNSIKVDVFDMPDVLNIKEKEDSLTRVTVVNKEFKKEDDYIIIPVKFRRKKQNKSTDYKLVKLETTINVRIKKFNAFVKVEEVGDEIDGSTRGDLYIEINYII